MELGKPYNNLKCMVISKWLFSATMHGLEMKT